MSSGKGLEVLVREKRNILLAEVAALLHDWQKTIDRAIAAHWKNNPSLQIKAQSWQQRGQTVRPKELSDLLSAITLGDPLQQTEDIDLKTLCEKGKDPSSASKHSDWRVQLLGNAHNIAHIDKELAEQEFRNLACDKISSPFGYEFLEPCLLFEPLLANTRNFLSDSEILVTCRSQFIDALKNPFKQAWGDTRRPVNEVTLWDWSTAVAALYKSAIASALLSKPSLDLRQIQWRLLRISFDGLSFLQQAPSIGDMLGRKKVLTEALDRVKELLEETHPLGNEVYRDENGSAFVIPALEGDDKKGNTLRGMVERLILDVFRQGGLEGEVRPSIAVSAPSREASTLHELLTRHFSPLQPFKESISRWWQGEPANICTVCGLRPQGWGTAEKKLQQKARERNICSICLKRREGRAEEWATKTQNTTIWINEVADKNNRVALILGYFDLRQWWNGDMIQTMLMICDPANPEQKKRFVAKNPSFARLHRVWRTTKEFWENIQKEEIPQVINEKHYRLLIALQNGDEVRDKLGRYHVYDAEMRGNRFAVVWDDNKKCFITAENLVSRARRMDAGREESADSCSAATFILDHLPEVISIYEPGGYGQRRQKISDLRINRSDSKIADISYTPYIPLFAEPILFMILVPADKALEALEKIKEKYERELGKVRNRLPLFLGMIFFDHYQPLFSVLDTAKRWLKYPLEVEQWEVKEVEQKNASDAPEHLKPDSHFTHWMKLVLSREEQEMSWCIPLQMGDGNTSDIWYPYYQVLQDNSGHLPAFRQYHFKIRNNDKALVAGDDLSPEGEHWIHVKKLQPGDKINLTPSRFTSLYLHTSARRFEAEQQGVWVLEELASMTKLWQKLKTLARARKLTDTKLHAVVSLLGTKKESWQDTPETFKNFTRSVLKAEGLDEVITEEDVLSKRLFRTFELYHRMLYHRILKEGVQEG